MGNFYTNITLRGPGQADVAAALAGRRAYVAPAAGGFTVVYDEQSDEQDPATLGALAGDLSREFRCPALAVLNHDDDILAYWLYDQGTLVDSYDSAPGYFTGKAGPPEGGNAKLVCEAMGAAQNAADVDRILRRTDFVFAIERHEALAGGLGLPAHSVGAGYKYISDGELPSGLSAADLQHTA